MEALCLWSESEGPAGAGCDRPARYPGYRDVWRGPLCEKHWARLRAEHEIPCRWEGCRSEAVGVGGYCRRHEGEPLRALSPEQREALYAALVARIEARGRIGCWMWTGRQTDDGYGVFDPPGELGTWLAHRLVWSLFFEGHENGEWDNPMELDHLCTRQEMTGYFYGGSLCVNPLHLNPATRTTNRALRDKRAAEPFRPWHNMSLSIPRPMSLVWFGLRFGLPFDGKERYVSPGE